MHSQPPIFATAATAAALLDMTKVQFLALWRERKIPDPFHLDSDGPRWSVAELEAWAKGRR